MWVGVPIGVREVKDPPKPLGCMPRYDTKTMSLHPPEDWGKGKGGEAYHEEQGGVSKTWYNVLTDPDVTPNVPAVAVSAAATVTKPGKRFITR